MKTLALIAALWFAFMFGFMVAAVIAAASRRDDAYLPPAVPPRPDVDDPEERRRYNLNRWPGTSRQVADVEADRQLYLNTWPEDPEADQ